VSGYKRGGEIMKKERANFMVNGKLYEIIIEPRMLLVDVLRERMGLTGTKYACGTGDCGACTVLVDGKPILSCLTLAVTVRDKNILTIEGIADGNTLHPLQQAFIDNGAVQCGYCIPGMVLSAKALLEENPKPTRNEIQAGLAGNLCRCTGYVKIVDAVQAAVETMGKGGKS
jgi:carbon-monoxide dehydrogenase small subunit